MSITHPEVLWAQRSSAEDIKKNILYLTVRIPDAKNYTITLAAEGLKIDSDSDDSKDHYKLDLEFFESIDKENSRYSVHGNQINFTLRKAKAQEEYWPRLVKEKLKLHYVKTDFDKWVDEDEQNEHEEPEEGDEPGADSGNFDLQSLLAQQAAAGGDLGFGNLGQNGFPPVDQANTNEEDFSSSDEDDEHSHPIEDLDEDAKSDELDAVN